MKAAVGYLEPFMERIEGQEKGIVVLATVRGDVHDIGKNLVDIILTNNGYRVVNLGIKQPIATILDAAVEHKAHAIGMSGLLVKSTVVMRENLEEMTRLGLDMPVMLGGAALTRRYVEEDCVKAYACGRVAYARDAFDGLALMDRITGNDFDGYLGEVQQKNIGRPKNESRKLGRAADARVVRPVDLEEIRLPRRAEPGRTGAAAAFLGAADDRPRASQGDRALSQRAHALPIPVGLPERGPHPRRIQGVGEKGAPSGPRAHLRHRDSREHPGAASRLRLLALRRRRQ
jgi:cobalamin-dependent methionine synthase I